MKWDAWIELSALPALYHWGLFLTRLKPGRRVIDQLTCHTCWGIYGSSLDHTRELAQRLCSSLHSHCRWSDRHSILLVDLYPSLQWTLAKVGDLLGLHAFISQVMQIDEAVHWSFLNLDSHLCEFIAKMTIHRQSLPLLSQITSNSEADSILFRFEKVSKSKAFSDSVQLLWPNSLMY